MLASTCQCVAHTTKMSSVSDLINITEPLTDDSGNLLADVMISLILKKASLAEKLRFQSCKQGSPYTVNYILQVPNEIQLHSQDGLIFQL